MPGINNILKAIQPYGLSTVVIAALVAGVSGGTMMQSQQIGKDIRDEIVKANAHSKIKTVQTTPLQHSDEPFELQLLQATTYINTLPVGSEKRDKLIEYWYAAGILNLDHVQPQSSAIMLHLQSLRQTQNNMFAIHHSADQRSIAP